MNTKKVGWEVYRDPKGRLVCDVGDDMKTKKTDWWEVAVDMVLIVTISFVIAHIIRYLTFIV
jgi:hypothetical protein